MGLVQCGLQDTPRSEDQFGSLVVCLPVPHEGGSLVVRHGGSEQVLLKNHGSISL